MRANFGSEVALLVEQRVKLLCPSGRLDDVNYAQVLRSRCLNVFERTEGGPTKSETSLSSSLSFSRGVKCLVCVFFFFFNFSFQTFPDNTDFFFFLMRGGGGYFSSSARYIIFEYFCGRPDRTPRSWLMRWG